VGRCAIWRESCIALKMENQGVVDGDQLIAESPEPRTGCCKEILQDVFLIFASLVAIGLVQLLGWLGDGESDPFIPNLTVLQFTAIIASAIQIIVFVPSFVFQTEKFYDLTGSLTYLVCLGYSLGAGYVAVSRNTSGELDARAIVATCFVTLWAVRLGYFLFRRIHQAKKDGRFDSIKPHFPSFFVAWNIQGLWIFLGCLPTFTLNATQRGTGFNWTDIVGGALFVIGFLGEIVSDNQKSSFNSNPVNKGKWIDVGLWRYSRHPNYFCEWLLQFGLFVFCLSEFQGTQWFAVLSPVFIAVLLLFISGVPLLEKRAAEKWGGNPDYESYKRSTSLCILCPKLPSEEEDMYPCQKLIV